MSTYEAKHELRIAAPRQSVYDLLENYEAYPSYLDDFHSVRVDQVVNRRAFVTFRQQILRAPFRYTLALDHKSPHQIQWSLSHSDQLEVHSGLWEIQEEGPGASLLTVRCKIALSQWIPEVMFSRSQDDFWNRMLQAIKTMAETP